MVSGHGTSVTSAVWSHDGGRIYTASGDRTVRMYDAATGRLLREIGFEFRNVDLLLTSDDQNASGPQ